MAEATKSTVVRTVTEETFTLTLSADEFQYLMELLGRQTVYDGGGACGRIYDSMTEDLRTNEVTPEPNMAVKVGDRVRILEAPGAERFHGRVGTVLSVLGSHPTDLCTCSVTVEGCGTLIWATKVGPTTYTVDGTAYDLSAEYRDTSGDVWFFTGERNGAGVPLLSCRTDDDECTGWSLIRLHDFYDTLTRV
ncbi:phiSA1p31-related protein [Streptomyces albidoflavus]|uniref:phiSA1p31-related protein n=1 Tax=Streptomyces albidoflavus TaxID=1886 RepID=UPI0004CC4AC3|nr:phiSA1p31-related protein [Streptomyces albidoflavus]